MFHCILECHILTMEKDDFATFENKAKGLEPRVRGEVKGLYKSTESQWGSYGKKFDMCHGTR